MDTKQLKPCPFCGGEAELKHLGEHYGASCRDWKCQGMQGALMHRGAVPAVNAWNGRAALTPSDAVGAPIYQYRLVSGEWVDFPEHDGRMHIERGHTVRVVYAAPVAPAATAPQAPVAADAARAEPIGKVEEFSGKHGLTWNVDPETLPVGTNLYAETAQQPARASEAGEAFPYQRTFDAIAAATTIKGGHIAISVRKFQEAYGSAQQAVTLTDDARDAARYRHLRDCNGGSLIIVQITGMGEDDQVVLTESDADAAIDAALQSHEGDQP